MSKIVVRE